MNPHEKALRDLLNGWENYAYAHEARYGTIAHDYVLGPAWLSAGKAILALLNGETGKLDCGAIDARIRHVAKRHGFVTESEEL